MVIYLLFVVLWGTKLRSKGRDRWDQISSFASNSATAGVGKHHMRHLKAREIL